MTETLSVPFFRPDIGEEEIQEVLSTLRSGWLTTGPRVKRFEREFAAAVGAAHAVAVNSCTAALHLAVEALELKPGEAVVIPTMTFAATAEVVRYLGAIPLLVDCDPATLNMDLGDASRKLEDLPAGRLPNAIARESHVIGVIPVHVGGLMMDITLLKSWARENDLWVVEDAAHAFPASWRPTREDAWQRCGEGTARVSCFSFYANKTITTGEGGMAVTEDWDLARRMRMMSLHGLSHDAWGRYSSGGSWDYRILAPGYKYNLTDIAAAIGIHQLARAEQMREKREAIARRYLQAFEELEEIELPPESSDRIHSWHLFPIKLRLERLWIDRNQFLQELKAAGVGGSVHWRPLHLHPYYQETFGWRPSDFPVATALWERLISLPIFPGMREEEVQYVIGSVEKLCARHRRPSVRPLKRAAEEDPPFRGGVGEAGTVRSGIPRGAEAALALAGLALSAPFLAAAAVGIAVTSRGPALFRQERVGRGGKTFRLYKLRTMRSCASGPELTARDDARITPVGKLLRRAKLDELPQLWNVLKGEMSLVGPRPEVSRYVDLGNPLWKEILQVRPGLTDPVTLLLRNEEALLAGVEGDRETFYREELQPRKLREYIGYLRRRSWRTDFAVLWKTGLGLLSPAKGRARLAGSRDSNGRRYDLLS